MNAEQREETYRTLINLLRTHGPIGAADVARLSGIKLAAAYQRIRALEKQGVRLVITAVPNGKRGPYRTLFALAAVVPETAQVSEPSGSSSSTAS